MSEYFRFSTEDLGDLIALRSCAQTQQDDWDNYDREAELEARRTQRDADLVDTVEDDAWIEYGFPPVEKAGPGWIGVAPRRILAILNRLDETNVENVQLRELVSDLTPSNWRLNEESPGLRRTYERCEALRGPHWSEQDPIDRAVDAHRRYIWAARAKTWAVTFLDDDESQEMIRRIKMLRAEGVDV